MGDMLLVSVRISVTDANAGVVESKLLKPNNLFSWPPFHSSERLAFIAGNLQRPAAIPVRYTSGKRQ